MVKKWKEKMHIKKSARQGLKRGEKAGSARRQSKEKLICALTRVKV